jgi:hypothetical protein
MPSYLATSYTSTLEVTNSELLARKIPGISVTPNKLTAVLSNFRPRTFKFGSKKYFLGTNDVRHILERHHPSYWNGTSKPKQTFLNQSMSVNEVVNGIEAVVSQNRTKLYRLKPSGDQVEGVYKGVKYILGVDGRGRIRQFFPKP